MHGLLDGGRVNLLLEILAHELLNAREGLLQRGLSERAFTTELAVHGETAPLCHGRGLVLFAGLQELNSGLRGEHFIKVIVDLNHGGVDAGTEALHLKEGKLAVLGGLTVLDTKVIRDGLLDLTSTAGHARGGTAKLNEVLANGLTVEHSVESGNLVDAHGAAAEDLCYFVHGGDREKVVVLPLCKVEEGNACGLLVVARVLLSVIKVNANVIYGEQYANTKQKRSKQNKRALVGLSTSDKPCTIQHYITYSCSFLSPSFSF